MSRKSIITQAWMAWFAAMWVLWLRSVTATENVIAGFTIMAVLATIFAMLTS